MAATVEDTARPGIVYRALIGGHYYAGSTSQTLYERIAGHYKNSVRHPDQKFYAFVAANGGWGAVSWTTVETGCWTLADLRRRENTAINLDDPLCLNDRIAWFEGTKQEYLREYYAEHSGHLREYRKDHWSSVKEDPEKLAKVKSQLRAAAEKRLAADPEGVRAVARERVAAYRERNRDIIRAREREKYTANLEESRRKGREKARERYARKKAAAASPDIPAATD